MSIEDDVILLDRVPTFHLLGNAAIRVLAIGSGDAYGDVHPDELPVDERCAFRPLSPYGASKAALDLIAYQWVCTDALDIVRMRPFNHTGPGQRPDFVCPDFARQLVSL